MEAYAPQTALVDVFKVISRANKYIDENLPWLLAKDEAKRARLATVLYNLLETVRVTVTLLKPFMPESCDKIFAQIGAAPDQVTWDSAARFGLLNPRASVQKGEAVFPRIDMNKELEALEALNAPVEEQEELPSVTIDEFAKVRMTVCRVLSCENVKKSDKLLRFDLDDGSGKVRRILSGIAKYYKAEELVGKTVLACTNLPPRKMMGELSCGMLLSVEKGDKLQLIILPDDMPVGGTVC
jgi:methionyl-tRNA synthetase